MQRIFLGVESQSELRYVQSSRTEINHAFGQLGRLTSVAKHYTRTHEEMKAV